jgi:hypothetical protein
MADKKTDEEKAAARRKAKSSKGQSMRASTIDPPRPRTDPESMTGRMYRSGKKRDADVRREVRSRSETEAERVKRLSKGKN